MLTEQEIKKQYNRWLSFVTEGDLLTELQHMDESGIHDAFYCNLAFGTGGLRGLLGAGTNRMNIYTVAKASQGLANYLNKQAKQKRIAISYDSRHKSEIFSRVAACVFAANGLQVFLYKELMPTPCLSYAVRKLNCAAGVMITASHNPAMYNGYKVYGSDGCQITIQAANGILAEIEKLDIFEDEKFLSFEQALQKGKISYIPVSVYDEFIQDVKKQSVLYGDEINKELSIVYTPLHGTGFKPVTRILKEAGFTNVTVVQEQISPDGDFPTCPQPNPEVPSAMQMGIACCQKVGADLLLATDPDCDRCGVAVKAPFGYQLLTGNEIGLLLLDFICSQRVKHGKMPKAPVFVKTIVTTDLAEKIANSYHVRTINVLTGFKFIGETIARLEKEGEDYICGFEESYGYLTGTYVRDKDAVNAALMICEMSAFYKMQHLTLLQKLEQLYQRYGYARNSLYSYQFEGKAGMRKMQEIMERLRKPPVSLAGYQILQQIDYNQGVENLPKANVLKYQLQGGHSIVMRPSGTEPKLKIYFSLLTENPSKACHLEQQLKSDLERLVCV